MRIYYIILIMVFFSCTKKPEIIIVRDNFNAYGNINSSNFTSYLDTISFMGYKIGETTLKDLGSNYYVSPIITKSENVFVYEVSFNQKETFEDQNELLRNDIEMKNFSYKKKIKYKDSNLILSLDFYNKKLFRISMKDFPISFLDTFNIQIENSTGYIRDNCDKLWNPKIKSYEINAYHDISLEWKSEKYEMLLKYKSDTLGYDSDPITNLKSDFVIVDKKIEILYLNSRKDSESDVKKNKLLTELSKLTIKLKMENLSKESKFEIIDRMAEIQNEIDKIK